MHEDDVLTIDAAALLANDTDPDGNSTIRLSQLGAIEGRGTLTYDGATITVRPSADFNGSLSFDYTIADTANAVSYAWVFITVEPVNDPPVILGTTHFTFDEGPDGYLGSGPHAFARDVDKDTLTYTWSEAAGVSFTASGPNLSRLIGDDGPWETSTTVTVTDGHGGSATATMPISVRNVAPVIEIDRDPHGAWGIPFTVSATVTDPSAADTSAGLGPAWHVTLADGSQATTTGTSVDLLYPDPGSWPATVTATDKDGGSTERATTIYVGPRRGGLKYFGPATATYGFAWFGARLTDLDDPGTARLSGRSLAFVVGGSAIPAKTVYGYTAARLGGAVLPGTYTPQVMTWGDQYYDAWTSGTDLTIVNGKGQIRGRATLADGTPVAASIVSDGTAVTGTFAVGAFTASTFSAFGTQGDEGWVAGTGDDGRSFVAHVAGRSLQLWIDGVQTVDAAVTSGRLSTD
jgi:hypothetical protein